MEKTKTSREHQEWLYRLVTFETFDQSDEETWPDQKMYLPTYLPTLENTLKERVA